MTWILCPQLRAEISHLEDAGWVTRLQRLLLLHSDHARLLRQGGEEVASPPGHTDTEEYMWSRRLCVDMEAAHRRYAEERWARVTEEDKVAVSAHKGWTVALQHTGIAGIRNPHTVKCLHWWAY